MKFVIDASVAARWYILGESHANADAVLRRVIAEPDLFAVPELFFFEVLAVLGRVHPHPAETYQEAFLPVVEAAVFRHPMTPSLAGQSCKFLAIGLTGCDACYAGLAVELGARWITFDRRAHELIEKQDVSFYLGDGLPGRLVSASHVSDTFDSRALKRTTVRSVKSPAKHASARHVDSAMRIPSPSRMMPRMPCMAQ